MAPTVLIGRPDGAGRKIDLPSPFR